MSNKIKQICYLVFRYIQEQGGLRIWLGEGLKATHIPATLYPFLYGRGKEGTSAEKSGRGWIYL